MPSGGRWKVYGPRSRTRLPIFVSVRSQVQRPDGVETEYHTLDFPRPAVAIVLRDEAGRVLLIRQQRFIVGRDVWALPSGGVEVGESPEIAAARELIEETGMRAAGLTPLMSFYPSYGVSNQVFHCFVARPREREGTPDANEVERTAWFTPVEVRAIIIAGDIPDGFSLVPLLQLLADVPAQDDQQVARCAVVSLLR